MSGVKGKKWVVKNSFVGFPKHEDVEIIEQQLTPLKDGGIKYIMIHELLIIKYLNNYVVFQNSSWRQCGSRLTRT